MKITNKLVIGVVLLLTSIYQAQAYSHNQTGIIQNTINKLLDEKFGTEEIFTKHRYISVIGMQKTEELGPIKSVTIDRLDTKEQRVWIKITYIDDSTKVISAIYKLYMKVPISRLYVDPGQIITENDVKTKDTEITTITKDMVIRMEDVIGMQSMTNVLIGHYFNPRMLMKPKIIKKNDPVDITYNSGAINLKTSGLALASGAEGDMIKVKNADSGTVLRAKVVNKNTVQVGN